uniref:Uncharacterized protein n=1 Tax=Aegilops tauschii subsp. strangulata TaxID=200361 RepID=A0A453CSN1_AEGTS
ASFHFASSVIVFFLFTLRSEKKNHHLVGVLHLLVSCLSSIL